MILRFLYTQSRSSLIKNANSFCLKRNRCIACVNSHNYIWHLWSNIFLGKNINNVRFYWCYWYVNIILMQYFVLKFCVSVLSMIVYVNEGILIRNRVDLQYPQVVIFLITNYYWKIQHIVKNMHFCCKKHYHESFLTTVKIIAIDQIVCTIVYYNNYFNLPFTLSVIILWKLRKHI